MGREESKGTAHRHPVGSGDGALQPAEMYAQEAAVRWPLAACVVALRVKPRGLACAGATVLGSFVVVAAVFAIGG